MSRGPLKIVLGCAELLMPKVRYVFDTLFMAAGIPVAYSHEPPATGPWVLYTSCEPEPSWPISRCLAIAHCPRSWRLFERDTDVEATAVVDGMLTVLPGDPAQFWDALTISCDIIANAFYFLSSWSERAGQHDAQTRQMHSTSVCQGSTGNGRPTCRWYR